jgi:hypothetical protein
MPATNDAAVNTTAERTPAERRLWRAEGEETEEGNGGHPILDRAQV